MLSTPLPLAFLAGTASSRFWNGVTDTTFSDIHRLGWFDWAILVPYFTILAILSVYGLHRYDVIRTYFKYRKNATKEPRKLFDHQMDVGTSRTERADARAAHSRGRIPRRPGRSQEKGRIREIDVWIGLVAM